MRILIAPIALLAACSPMAGDEHAVSPAHPEDERSYATQVEAPTPDYAELMRAEASRPRAKRALVHSLAH